MERSVLDTDTFSEVLRRRDVTIRDKADAYLSVFEKFTLSVITIAEIVDGFRRQRLDVKIAELLTQLQEEHHEVLSLDTQSGVVAGHIFGDLHRIGQPIGRADPYIAAIAITSGIPLVTGNLAHFERVQALGYPLRLESWHGTNE